MAETFTIDAVTQDKGASTIVAKTSDGDVVKSVVVGGRVVTISVTKNAIAQDEVPLPKSESVVRAAIELAKTKTDVELKALAGKSVTYDETKPQPVTVADVIADDPILEQPIGEVKP